MKRLNEDSAMFQHMVRAITKSLGGASKDNIQGAINIAKAQLRKHGYTKKPGKVSQVPLTGKGRKRSRDHSREADHKRKKAEYEQLLTKLHSESAQRAAGVIKQLDALLEVHHGCPRTD